MFTELPNGDELETGVMPAPHLGGQVLPYEEVWHQLNPTRNSSGGAKGSVSWILESVDGSRPVDEGVTIKSYYAKTGRYYLALRRREDASRSSLTFSAVRQDWDDAESRWTTKYEIGNVHGMLVMGEDVGSEGEWVAGDQVTIGPENEACVIRSVAS